MAIVKYCNSVAQAGVFYTGTPNYVDVDHTFTVPSDRISFAAMAANAAQPGGAWTTGDLIGVEIYKSGNNYKVWRATWDATNEFLLLEKEELSVGTISNGDAVTVAGVLTPWICYSFSEPQTKRINTTTYTLLASDDRKILQFYNGSTCDVAVDSALPVGFFCTVIREDMNVVMNRTSTDTINGTTYAVTPYQWDKFWLYQPTEGAWKYVKHGG